MRKLVTILLLGFSGLFFGSAVAQESCQVLVPELKGSYEGDCKNGLAQGKGVAKGVDTYTGTFKKGYPNGKGKYVWSTGEVYDGDWKAGVREGEGRYTYLINGRDTVIDGLWKENKYQGPKPLPPKVTQKVNISSTSFIRAGDGDQLTITITQSGLSHPVEDFFMVGSSGSEFSSGSQKGYQGLTFPFQCKINYSSWNPLQTVLYRCILEFEITQPGRWELRIEN